MIELQVSATKKIPLIKVILLEGSTAQPTPLVLTFWTGHVIAAFIGYLSDSSFTLFTVNDVALCLRPFSIV